VFPASIEPTPLGGSSILDIHMILLKGYEIVGIGG
jgi:hypothetical protein